VASGTDALHLALIAEGIGAGDEVITTAFTFIATAEAIKYVGAVPVFVDIDPRTFNISPEAIEKAITPKPKRHARAFVWPAGRHARIKQLCDQHNLKLIEDCCQSFGATINGKQTGSIGHVSSVFPAKTGAFGDGGLVTTNSTNARQKSNSCNHGSDCVTTMMSSAITAVLMKQAVILRPN
jgi:dTDP-4-amino-4,6-dideoxygalactose transaminase